MSTIDIAHFVLKREKEGGRREDYMTKMSLRPFVIANTNQILDYLFGLSKKPYRSKCPRAGAVDVITVHASFHPFCNQQ